jgi:hypothetical protein
VANVVGKVGLGGYQVSPGVLGNSCGNDQADFGFWVPWLIRRKLRFSAVIPTELSAYVAQYIAFHFALTDVCTQA